MADDKSLKFLAVFDTKGGEKLQKILKDAAQGFKDISNAAKNFSKDLQDVGKFTKDINAVVNENVRKLNELSKAFASAGNSARNFGGAVNGGRAGLGKGLGMAGGAMGLGVSAFSAYNDILRNQAQRAIADKTMGLENLAGAQGFRNYKFMEAMSAPVGYAALKRYSQFDVRTRESNPMVVDSAGNIVGADQGPMRRGAGPQHTQTAADMSANQKLIETQKNDAWIKLGFGVAKALGGAGLIAGAVGGTAATAGLGAIGGVAMASGGAAMIFNGIKEAIAAGYERVAVGQKTATGRLSVEQNEAMLRAEKAQDEILAIQRFQLSAFQGSAGERIGIGRQSMGTVGITFAGGFSGAERAAVQSGLLRQFGGYGQGGPNGRGGNALSTVLGAMNMGFSAGGAAQMVGTGAMVGGGGKDTLQQVIAAGLAQGWKSLDVSFFEKIGTAFASKLDSATSGRRLNANALGAAMFAGLGPAATANDIAARGQTAALDKELFRNNSYFSGRSLIAASNILGGNANGVQIGALGRASFDDLLGNTQKLKALGITDAQVKQMRTTRTNMLGDVLSSDKVIAGFMGGGTFENLLQNLTTGVESKNKGVRGAAQSKLYRIAAVASEVLGEEDFKELQSLFLSYGVTSNAISSFRTGRRNLPGHVDATASGVLRASSESQKRQQERGKKLLEDRSETGLMAQRLKQLTTKSQTEELTPEEMEDVVELNKVYKGGKSTERAITAINRVSDEEADAAAKAGGYDSAQQVMKDLGAFGKAIQDLTKILTASETRRAFSMGPKI